MARMHVLSNGSLHVGINKYGLVHDFYYPHVGLENHVAGKLLRHKIGVWVDGSMSWLDDDSWQFDHTSEIEAPIGHIMATSLELGVTLEFEDFVDAHESALIRRVTVRNRAVHTREIRLFFHQAFTISDIKSNTDTAQYLPSSNAILHYRGARAFVVGLSTVSGEPFDQHSIGLFGIEGHAGTYKDAEDGELSGNDVEHGRVDSVIRRALTLEANEAQILTYWISAGTALSSAVALHDRVLKHGADKFKHRTKIHWSTWLEKAKLISDRLPIDYRDSFLRSAVLVKSHIDNEGAVIASSDTTMLNYARDAYAYSWPRDGAYAVWPLIRMGYKDEALAFFRFSKRTAHPSGYLMHKYYADGGVGPSWHPYRHGDEVSPPIQEDETALVGFVFAQFYELHPDKALIDEFYESFIRKIGDFLTRFVGDKTHLPLASYDLWEEKYQTTTYTTALVQATLRALAEIAQVAGDEGSAVEWRTVADEMQSQALKLLYDVKEERFRKGILAGKDSISYDNTIDASSLYGVFMFGLVSASSDELQSTYRSVNRQISSKDGLVVQRYDNDDYHRKQNQAPNGWHICALWIAQYLMETGENMQADTIIRSVISHTTSTGMLSEQFDPISHESASVSPLTWSHAELLSSMLDTVESL